MIRMGLIGAHIGQSRLSAALDILAHAHGTRAHFTPIDTAHEPKFSFDETLACLRAEGWTGVTVTHPWKSHAAEYAGPGMDRSVRNLGAANLLLFNEGGVTGHNTDYSGFLAAWATTGTPPGRVAMAGAGGVARAIGPALSALGADEITIWDPREGLAEDLAARIGPAARAVAVSESVDVILRVDGLVNATPLGMVHDPGTAFAEDLIGAQKWAFDAVYTPTDTAFLRSAAKRGLKIITGFDLFCHMALGTFALYSGIAPDPASALPLLSKLRPKETADA